MMLRSFLTRPAMKRALIAIGLVCIMVALSGEALAQIKFEHMQKNIGKDAALVPKLVAVLAYVIGVYFTADGLLKLKAWMEDSEKNPLNPAIFRLFIAVFLIWLPHGMYITNATLLGEDANNDANIPFISPPNLGAFDKKKN